jgi:hypothetical protein
MSEGKKMNLSELLSELGINTVVYVDDLFGDTYKVEDFLGVIEAVFDENSGKLKGFERFFDLSGPSEVRNDNIRKYWEEQPVEVRLNLFNELKRNFPKEVEEVIKPEDSDTIRELVSEVPRENLLCLSPSEWEAQKEKLLAGEGNRIVIFDEQLGEERTGTQLLQEAITANSGVTCCILTNHITIEGENTFRSEISNKFQIDFDKLVVLSKERARNNDSSLSDGIKKSLLINHWNEIKDAVLEIMRKAFSKMEEEITDRFDTFVFDDVILKSSLEEGVSEAETIFRLSNILYQNHAKNTSIEDDFFSLVSMEVQKARIINKYTFSDISSPKYPISLRHLELFEAGDTLNKLFSPLRNGDIFQLGDDLYILVGQPCDMMVRKTGERNSKVALLLELKLVPRNQAKGYTSISSFSLPYFESDGSKVGIVGFKNKYFIDYDVLDLCVFNSGGTCTLDIKSQTCPNQLHLPWQIRFTEIKRLFENISANLLNIDSAIESVPDLNMKESLKRLFLPYPTVPRMPLKTPYFDGDSILDFGIFRVQHLYEPRSSLLLKTYNRYVSRDAESHDFASTILKD